MAKPVEYTGAKLYHGHGFTGKGVVVAVVDTGVQPHPDLTLLNGWGDNGWKPNEDLHGHGTHVAGIACGKKYGVAPDAKVLPVRISRDGPSNTFTMTAALKWLVEWRKNHTERLVVNISYTGTESPYVREQINRLVAMDVPVCVAAGNTGGELAEIADYDSPIVVANLHDKTHIHSSSSCRGKQTDCATIGTEVYSCDIDGTYRYMTGTSMASPAVAGMMALILSRWPDISEADAYKELMRCGEDELVKCRDGLHYIPAVNFHNAPWNEDDCEEDNVRENAKIKGVSSGMQLIVREAPNSSSAKVGNVRNNYEVVAMRESGGWREIAFSTAKGTAKTGWINKKYVGV